MGTANVTVSFALLAFVCATVCWFADEVVARPNVSDSAGGTEPPAISLETLYQRLLNQSAKSLKFQFVHMWVAASDGDDFYRTQVNTSDECRRTAQASMKLLLAFPTADETDRLVSAAIKNVSTKVRNEPQTKHPLEWLCVELDQQLRASANLSSAYVGLAEGVNDTSTLVYRKYYFDYVLSWDTRRTLAELKRLFAPAVVKLLVLGRFKEQQRAHDRPYNVLARAIVEVAKNDAFKDKVERIREKVSSDVITDLEKTAENDILLLVAARFKLLDARIMEKFEKYFNEDADLKEELKSAKEAITS